MLRYVERRGFIRTNNTDTGSVFKFRPEEVSETVVFRLVLLDKFGDILYFSYRHQIGC